MAKLSKDQVLSLCEHAGRGAAAQEILRHYTFVQREHVRGSLEGEPEHAAQRFVDQYKVPSRYNVVNAAEAVTAFASGYTATMREYAAMARQQLEAQDEAFEAWRKGAA